MCKGNFVDRVIINMPYGGRNRQGALLQSMLVIDIYIYRVGRCSIGRSGRCGRGESCTHDAIE
jgi:hypothetical protein